MPQRDPSLSRADQLACYIARNYQQPLTSVAIAQAVGLHPNHTMNLFRRAFGTTTRRFLAQHRLSHAQRLLVTTNDSILEIALASGFQSLSRFNEVFKAACGCSPGSIGGCIAEDDIQARMLLPGKQFREGLQTAFVVHPQCGGQGLGE
ncbi:MAG: hypothetical protein Kow00109_00760 [Acidobacteriota bacterium]